MSGGSSQACKYSMYTEGVDKNSDVVENSGVDENSAVDENSF